MKRVARNGVIAVAAASGAMALTMPVAAALAADGGSGAAGSTAGSPGLISGNTIQLPVHVPVNVCGNTVNVVGLLNPAAGNGCADEETAKGPAGPPGGAGAQSSGKDSPGVLSGNGVQLPVHLPVNVSGNSASVVGVGDAAVGNESVNTSGGRPHHPVRTTPRPPTPPKARPARRAARHTAPQAVASLAHTGTDQTLPAVAASAALVLGGAVLYRRFGPGAGR